MKNKFCRRSKFFSIGMLLFLMLFIIACGGGGGDSAPATYNISGAVSGDTLAGVTINLTGAATASATTDASGNFSFTGRANGTYTVTPVKAGYTFNPVSSVAIVSGASVTGTNFVATASSASTYSITGTVSGAASSGVKITLSGDNTGSVVTGGDGAYTISHLLPGNYTVTPSLTGFTFSPTSSTVTIDAAPSTGNNFVATAIPVAHSISGAVSGATLAGVAITVTGTATAAATTDAGGSYTVTGLYDGDYTVTPSKTGYTFAPTSTAVTMSGANITGTNFVASPNPTPTWSISGAVSGDVLSGVTITLSGGGSATTTTNASGNYSFSGIANGSYTVTPSLAGYTFSPANSAANVSGANITVASDFTSAVVTVVPKIVLVPVAPMTPAVVGVAYNHTVVASVSGGQSPYHYQLDTMINGAPPMGMIIDLSGNLTGTPSVAGTYAFGVCAVDMGGSSSCKATSIIVNPKTAATNDGTWNLQVAIKTCYEFTQTTPITITSGKFSGHLFQYCWNAKTGATWLGGSGCGGSVDQYWIGTQDVSVDLTVTGNNIDGNLTLTGSGCNGSNGFSSGYFDTATHGAAVSSWGTLTFSK